MYKIWKIVFESNLYHRLFSDTWWTPFFSPSPIFPIIVFSEMEMEISVRKQPRHDNC